MKRKRLFTVEQKMQILSEAEQGGIHAICNKIEIAQSLYYQLDNKLTSRGLQEFRFKTIG